MNGAIERKTPHRRIASMTTITHKFDLMNSDLPSIEVEHEGHTFVLTATNLGFSHGRFFAKIRFVQEHSLCKGQYFGSVGITNGRVTFERGTNAMSAAQRLMRDIAHEISPKDLEALHLATEKHERNARIHEAVRSHQAAIRDAEKQIAKLRAELERNADYIALDNAKIAEVLAA